MPDNDAIMQINDTELIDASEEIVFSNNVALSVMPTIMIDRTHPVPTCAEALNIDLNDIHIPADENELLQEDVQFDRYTLMIKPQLDAVLAMRRRGLTKAQVAHNIGVPVSYFNKCLTTHRELAEIYYKGKLAYHSALENAASIRALGSKVTLCDEKLTRDGDVVELKREVYYPPDPDMLKFLLTNLEPDRYKTKQDVTLGGSIDHQFTNIFREIAEKESAKRQMELEPPE